MDFNLAVVNEAVAAAVPDREAIVCGDRRLTYGQLAERTRRLANHLLARRARRAPGAVRAGRLGVGPGPPRPLPPQRQRVPRGDARRLQGPGRAVQRELPLRRRGAALPARPTPAPGRSSTTRRSPRRSTTVRGRPARRCEVLLQVRRRLGQRPAAGRRLVRGRAGRRPRPTHRPVEPRRPTTSTSSTPGGTTGMPKGVLWRQADIFLAALGGRAARHGRRVARPRRASSRRRRNGGARLMPGAAVHARRRPLAGVQRASAAATPSCSRATSRRLDPADVWSTIERRGGQHPADRRRRLRPAAASTSSTRHDYDLSLAAHASSAAGPP